MTSITRDRSDLRSVRFPSIRGKILSIEGRVERDDDVGKRCRRKSTDYRENDTSSDRLHSFTAPKFKSRRNTIGSACEAMVVHKSNNENAKSSSGGVVERVDVDMGEEIVEGKTEITISSSVSSIEHKERTCSLFHVDEREPVIISDNRPEEKHEEIHGEEGLFERQKEQHTKVPFFIHEVIIPEEIPPEEGECSEVDEDEDFDMDGLDTFFMKQQLHPIAAATTTGASVISASSGVSVTSMSTFSIMSTSFLLQPSMPFCRSGKLMPSHNSQRIHYISDYYLGN